MRQAVDANGFSGSGDANRKCGAGFLQSAGPAEGLEEMVEKDLGLALLITGEVSPAPRDEVEVFFPVGHA